MFPHHYKPLLTVTSLFICVLAACIAAEPFLASCNILPRGYVDGLTLSNNGSTPTTDIDFAAGTARDSSDTFDLANSATFTKRLQSSGGWSAGTSGNGLDSGARANSTWYHSYIIRKTSDGTSDFLFSTSATSPTLPGGYGAYRRIGAIKTNGSGNILTFSQFGDSFLWNVVAQDISAGTVGTTAALQTLSVPLGIKVEVITNVLFKNASAGKGLYLSSPDVSDEDLSSIVGTVTNPIANIYSCLGGFRVRTNTSSQIRARADAASSTIYIHTLGWIDLRGKDNS